MSEKPPHYVTLVAPNDMALHSSALASSEKKSYGRTKTILFTIVGTLLAVFVLGVLCYHTYRDSAEVPLPAKPDNPAISFIGIKESQFIYEARNLSNELLFINSARGTVTFENRLIGESDLGAFTMGPLAHRRLIIDITGMQIRTENDRSPQVWGSQKVTWTLARSDGGIIKFENEKRTSIFK